MTLQVFSVNSRVQPADYPLSIGLGNADSTTGSIRQRP
jgi:hypothetical protein